MKADLARATRMSESLVEPTEKEAERGDVEKAGRALVEGVEEPSGHLLPKASARHPAADPKAGPGSSQGPSVWTGGRRVSVRVTGHGWP